MYRGFQKAKIPFYAGKQLGPVKPGRKC